jgi:hypothetical protein
MFLRIKCFVWCNTFKSAVLKLMFGLMLLSLAVAEFIAAFYLAKAWHSRQIIKIILAGYLLLGGLTISVICGQATLQHSLDAAQQARRLQSDTYQAAVAQRKQAASQVAALSIDETQAVAARQALTALSAEKQAYLASHATNSRGQNAGTIGVRVGDCTGTSFYVKKYCGKIRTLDSQYRSAKLTVDKWNKYQSAKAHLDELESKPLPTGAKDDQLPGIAAIALMLETDGEQVGAMIFFCFSVFAEIATIILFFFYGSESAAKASGVSAAQPYIVQPPQQQSQIAATQTEGVSATQPYMVQPPQQQSQASQASGVSTTQPYIVQPPQQQSQVAPTQTEGVSATQPYMVQQPQQPQVATAQAQAEGVSAAQPYIVQPPQQQSQIAATQTEGVSATQPYIVQPPQQQSQVAPQAERVSATQPYIVQPPQQQSAPAVDIPSVYQQIVDDIHTKKLRNGSFRSLMTQYGLSQNQAAAIRMKLVTDGKAKFNRRHELDWV